MSGQAATLKDGCHEWENVTEGAYAHLERATYVLVQAIGTFESVSIRGTLFSDEATELELVRLTPGYTLQEIPFAPTRIRPVVTAGTATVRLYAPSQRG